MSTEPNGNRENGGSNGTGFARALFERWSSHPASLEKQKTVWLLLGLSPLAFLAIVAVLVLTGTSGWVSLFRHPDIWVEAAAVAFCISLGATTTFAVLSLMARGAFKRKGDIRGADRNSVSVPMLAVLAFFWVVPFGLSFAERLWGGKIVPGPLMFLLNLLCFLPFVSLLVWVQVLTCRNGSGKPKVRRPVWFLLGTAFLGLMVFSLLDGVPSAVLRSSFAVFLSKLGIDVEPALRKVVLFATLLPLSLVCYSVWLLFRRTMDGGTGAKGAPGEAKKAGKKSLFRRFFDWLFGRRKAPEETKEDVSRNPPEWVARFLAGLPRGIEVARDGGKENPGPLSLGEMSDYDETAEGDDLAFLMTGEVCVGAEDRKEDGSGEGETPRFRPTKTQTKFFRRFREVYAAALEKAATGAFSSPDMVLAGEEGSGRSELLRACALFAAFARGQHVLYVVSDLRQADKVRDKLVGCIDRMMLSSYLTCDILDAKKVIRWMAGVSVSDAGLAGEPIPTILVATPRTVEDCLFDNDRATDENSFNQLRHVIQSFEVVLVDDFMELDSTERAHMTFVVHKFQTLLAYKRVLPQIVVVTPRLVDGIGVSEVGDKLFGRSDFDLNNYLEMKPRPFPEGKTAWKLRLRVQDPDASPSDACVALVKICLKLGLDVVMYRKGITIQQCEDARNELVHGIETGSLDVISRLDQLSPDTEPDAVFYLAALGGDAGVSLRLNFGGEDSVFIQVCPAEGNPLDTTAVIPVLPNASAVSLRIHHLKSLLRFITPNEPMEESFWQYFGLSAAGDDVATVRRRESLSPSVEWGVDAWNEPEIYGDPLRTQIFLSGNALASNAGVRIRFSSLPLLKDDVYRIKGEPKIVLGVADGGGGESGEGSGPSPDALAEWVEGGRHLAGCDLSHAERLVLSRSDDGDFSGKPTVNVLTVRHFGPGDATCCSRIETKRWKGDGADFDTPVRTLSWTVEPVVRPQIHINAEDCTFLGFDLPESRGVPRFVKASIPRLLDANGRMDNVSPPAEYRYSAYGSAIVFLPRRFAPSEAEAQVQRFVAGSWTTDCVSSFSPAMTHVFAGVLKRIVPDFSFFAACPAFSVGGREDSIGEMVIWILEPTNSGKALNAVVERFFGSVRPRGANPFAVEADDPAGDGNPVDATRLVSAMLKAARKAESIADARARLRWLRAFSGTAVETPLETDADRDRLDEDARCCVRVLEELEKRLLCGYQPTGADDAPPLPGDASWIVRRKDLDSTKLLDSSGPDVTFALPDGFGIGTGVRRCKWTSKRRDLTLEYGFSDVASHESYERFLNENWIENWGSRISTVALSEYGENDPYRESLDALFVRLEREFAKTGAKRGQDGYERNLAEFLLRFVQGGMDYARDPELPDSDWPRFPTETLSMAGGDCEDTTILYMELLRRARIGCAYLHVPGHAAVGVCVDAPKTQSGKPSVSYEWLGKKYVYAETAMDKGTYLGLGEESGLISSAEEMPASVVPTPPPSPAENDEVRILNVDWDRDGRSVRFSVVRAAAKRTDGGKTLCFACFARRRKAVFDEPIRTEYPMLGAIRLPPLEEGSVFEGRIGLDVPDFDSWWLDAFVCEADTGAVRGHFVGAARFGSRGK